MPKLKASKKQRKAPGLVLCRCKTRCLTFNAERGIYEGPGEHVTPKTRSDHRRDERLHELLSSKAQGNTIAVPIPPGQDVSDDDRPPGTDNQHHWEEIIELRLNTFREMPVDYGGGADALLFCNSPKEYGAYEFEYPEFDDEAGEGYQELPAPFPNTGAHSLVEDALCNRRYLERESMLWEICRTLESFRKTESTVRLHREAFGQLHELEREKALRWETEREGFAAGPSFNTGMWNSHSLRDSTRR